MKKLRNMKWFVFFALLVFSTSCEKNFLDVNVDPNNPASSSVNYVLPAAMGSSAYVIGGWYQILGGMWAQHWTQSTGAQQYRNIDAYDIQTTDFDGRQYGELYTGALNDYEYVRKVASAEGNWTYYLIATLMQAYTYQVLADLYDNIPFDESLEGDKGLFLPKFNTGQEVYDRLISRIDEAMGKDFTLSSNKLPGSDDLVFGGDINQWIRFGNTLKLKIYLRQVYARPTVAENGIKALYNANAEFLTTDAAMTQFTDEQDRRNPVYETEVDRFGNINLAASNTLLNFLATNTDPRLDLIYNTPRKGGPHVGLDQGDYMNTNYTNAGFLSQPALNALDPVYFFTAAESYFLQAEAVAKGWGTGNDKTLYETGVTAAFDRLGAPDVDSFLLAGKPYEYPTGTFENKLKAIIVQKWVSMANIQGLEAFFEQNRTHYPDFFTISVNTKWGPTQFPKRLLYPDSEATRNPSNTPTLKRVYEAVWWDMK